MGQMQWRRVEGYERMVLHLREKPTDAWRSYSTFPQYRVPDLTIHGASKGWTTYQKMKLLNWELVPCGH